MKVAGNEFVFDDKTGFRFSASAAEKKREDSLIHDLVG